MVVLAGDLASLEQKDFQASLSSVCVVPGPGKHVYFQNGRLKTKAGLFHESTHGEAGKPILRSPRGCGLRIYRAHE